MKDLTYLTLNPCARKAHRMPISIGSISVVEATVTNRSVILKKLALILCVLMLGVGSAWGKTVTVDMSSASSQPSLSDGLSFDINGGYWSNGFGANTAGHWFGLIVTDPAIVEITQIALTLECYQLTLQCLCSTSTTEAPSAESPYASAYVAASGNATITNIPSGSKRFRLPVPTSKYYLIKSVSVTYTTSGGATHYHTITPNLTGTLYECYAVYNDIFNKTNGSVVNGSLNDSQVWITGSCTSAYGYTYTTPSSNWKPSSQSGSAGLGYVMFYTTDGVVFRVTNCEEVAILSYGNSSYPVKLRVETADGTLVGSEMSTTSGTSLVPYELTYGTTLDPEENYVVKISSPNGTYNHGFHQIRFKAPSSTPAPSYVEWGFDGTDHNALPYSGHPSIVGNITVTTNADIENAGWCTSKCTGIKMENVNTHYIDITLSGNTEISALTMSNSYTNDNSETQIFKIEFCSSDSYQSGSVIGTQYTKGNQTWATQIKNALTTPNGTKSIRITDVSTTTPTYWNTVYYLKVETTECLTQAAAQATVYNVMPAIVGSISISGTSSGSYTYKAVKLSGASSYIDITPKSGNFQVGDVLSVDMYNEQNTSQTLGFKLKSSSGTEHTTTGTIAKSSIGTIEYTLTESDIESNGHIKLYKGSYGCFAGYSVKRCPGTLAVTYNGNQNDGGTVPVDENTYNAGATVTVKTNSGSLTRDGYDFAGWNTAADGGGTTYSAVVPLGTFTINSSTTLYAKWTQHAQSTCYAVGDGDGVISATMPASGNNTATSTDTKCTFTSHSNTAAENATVYNESGSKSTCKISNGAGANPNVNYFEINCSDDITSLQLGVTAGASSGVQEYAMLCCTTQVFNVSNVSGVCVVSASKATDSKTLGVPSIPAGTKSIRIYRSVTFNNISYGKNSAGIYIYYVNACTGQAEECGATTPSVSDISAETGKGYVTFSANTTNQATNNTWYWQTAAEDASTSYPATTPRSLHGTSELTIYLRSLYDNGEQQCWSTAVSKSEGSAFQVRQVPPSSEGRRL